MDIDKDTYEGFFNHIWDTIGNECIFTELNPTEEKQAHSIAKALRDVANELIEQIQKVEEE
ncbi:hypothetical protein CMI47_00500 [Candidatus Pacearchaeota archaeon]|nr:hypothetical protein [Candidatus Pacearchaeota archaeon]|tara:strand:- start:280 stop:462 length:183 start_codon:yes stop_codon:yes gene_type:complete